MSRKYTSYIHLEHITKQFILINNPVTGNIHLCHAVLGSGLNHMQHKI